MSQFDSLKRKTRYSRATADGVVTNFSRGTSKTVDMTVSTVSMRQNTLSEGHPWHSRQRIHEDIGGPFKTERRYYSDHIHGGPKDPKDILQKVLTFRQVTSNQWTRYDGHVWPMSPNAGALSMIDSLDDSVWPQQAASTEEDLFALGTTAISLCKPTNSYADLSVAIAETLREGLPKAPGISTWKDRTNIVRGAGSEYLNAVFGWLPLLSEIKDVSYAAKHAGDLWDQYKRDAGRLVRRSYEFPVTRTTEYISGNSGNPYPNPGVLLYPSGQGSNQLSRYRHTWQRRWFDGAFTYSLPRGGDGGMMDTFFEGVNRARHLYGVSLDPEVLWNLTPWSWFIDWFSNTGAVISNLTDLATDGLVMRYGYMMEHTIVADELTMTGGSFFGGPRVNSSLCLVTETKQRVRASPYGFGLTFEDFSPRQLAILAALGMSRT